MPLTVAVQMDHIARINIRGDSTFALMLEGERRGHALFHYTPDRLAMRDGRGRAPRVEPVTVRDERGRPLHARRRRSAPTSRRFDVVLLRQDPPFDMGYITTTHLLERIQPKTLVVNDPAHVRNAPEKLFVTEFPDADAADADHPRPRARSSAFREEHGDIIVKPLYGNGGAGVFRIAGGDENLAALLEIFADAFREPFVVQRYLPEVRAGRQAHHPGRRRGGRRHQPRAGGGRGALQHACRRPAGADRADRARPRDLRRASARR